MTLLVQRVNEIPVIVNNLLQLLLNQSLLLRPAIKLIRLTYVCLGRFPRYWDRLSLFLFWVDLQFGWLDMPTVVSAEQILGREQMLV